MVISHYIDVDLGVVFRKIDDELRDESPDWWNSAVLADPDFRTGLDRLTDLSSVTMNSTSTEGGRSLARAAMHRGSTWGKRLAIVVSGDVGFGFARQYQSMQVEPPCEIRVFRNVEDAKEWLGIPSDYDAWAKRESEPNDS